MCCIDRIHPGIAREFRRGKFVMAKSQRKFSLIALDQGHEQNNGLMKEEGGIIRLTQDSDALLRLAVADPELVRVISEFEASMIGKRERGNTRQRNHHEQTGVTQRLFSKQVNALTSVIEGMGSPFEAESQDLLRLHSKDIMDKQSVDCLAIIQSKGQELYETFVEERLRTNNKPITATIARSKVVLFNEQTYKSKGKDTKVRILKSECSLFASLYVSCQTRNGDLNIFFSHENHPCPLSLSAYGRLHLGKSQISWAVLKNM